MNGSLVSLAFSPHREARIVIVVHLPTLAPRDLDVRVPAAVDIGPRGMAGT